MTFYPGPREQAVRKLMRETLYAGPYHLRDVEDWLARGQHTGTPRSEEEMAWAWEEIALIEKAKPGIIIRPEPEPEIMLEYDEVAS